MFLHASLDIRPSCSFIRLLAFIDGFVWHFLRSGLRWTFTEGINPCANTINIVFRKKIKRFIKLGTVATRNQMPVTKVPICRNNNICASVTEDVS